MKFNSYDLVLILTKIEVDLFKLIQPKEFLNSNWTKEKRQEKAQNIHNMIERSNIVARWIVKEIVDANDLRERSLGKQILKLTL
jgi:hypothetical protein